ncbi:hypothetical protein CEXT_223581 [Caerostris extrusa]|uniref:Secreted protein n=1 Tax=Caerostris extrusa TaxID=172846 RepID=A0AAV4XVY7_CAEEX|nr:hypothetical protein CEXT_223581 [Caerostris extrusa]
MSAAFPGLVGSFHVALVVLSCAPEETPQRPSMGIRGGRSKSDFCRGLPWRPGGGGKAIDPMLLEGGSECWPTAHVPRKLEIQIRAHFHLSPSIYLLIIYLYYIFATSLSSVAQAVHDKRKFYYAQA